MDTRTRSASPAALIDVKSEQLLPLQDKISAYYSLVFPHFTFYIQTLSVTIGRRCAPNPHAATSSTSGHPTVDVDLGALKSVSRLHAKIEYDQDEDRFVLVVIGRNGAWVDGVWCGSGSRAPLGERSQIQIASRTFHFILPPPPPPEDTPSPSSLSSANRPRSPSVDITSISPPSSQPSHSPPPPADRKLPAPPPEPQLPLSPSPKHNHLLTLDHQSQLPNSNSIGKSNRTGSKKRKKGHAEPPVLKPKPEDMPPKPSFTYAQLIYRAIKAIGEKATLQEICSWIMDTHEYYRYTDVSWMSSVRHNLSSSRAFTKLERCGGDRGKGFFWKLDEKHSQVFEEQEARNWQAGPAGGQSVVEGTGKRKKDKTLVMLDPPLKRSVKGEPKGTPLPPPLTSTPLPLKSVSTTATQVASATTSRIKDAISLSTPATAGVFAYATNPHNPRLLPFMMPGYAAHLPTTWTMHPTSSERPPANPSAPTLPLVNIGVTTNASQPPPLQPAAPPVADVSLPIVLGPIPTTHPDYSPIHPHNSAKEGYMILHEQTLILDPGVFGGLTKETLDELEQMGTIAALQVLKDHMVKVLKERRAKEKRKSGKRLKERGALGTYPSAPFSNTPLDMKTSVVPGNTGTSTAAPTVVAGEEAREDVLAPVPAPAPVVQERPDSGAGPMDCGSPIVVVDDDSGDDGPALKRRKYAP